MEKTRKSFLRTTSLVNPRTAIVSTLPALISIVLLGMLPAIVNLVISFTDYHGLGQPYEFVGFTNYIKAFSFRMSSITIWSALKNTLIFSFFVVLIQQPISLLVALILSRKFKGRSFFRALFFMPTILGISVVGFMWQLVFDPVSGPVAVILNQMNITSALLGDDSVAMGLVIFVTIWANFGYAMVIYIAGIQGIPADIKEAAIVDGVTPIQMFFRIILPLLKNTLVINYWISISGTLAMFDIIFVLTNGTANTCTFALFFFNLATSSSANQGQAAALNIYFSLFVTTIMLVFNFLFRRKEKD